jgi:HlyD family secretion protein
VRAHVEAARARVKVADAAVDQARVALHELRVEAPFSGTILTRLVQPGEVVAVGTPLATLVDLSRVHAKIYVASRELGRVRLEGPARVYADAFPGRAFDATVAEVAQHAEFTPRDVHMADERATLVFAVKLAVANPDGALKPGMPVEARIP